MSPNLSRIKLFTEWILRKDHEFFIQIIILNNDILDNDKRSMIALLDGEEHIDIIKYIIGTDYENTKNGLFVIDEISFILLDIRNIKSEFYQSLEEKGKIEANWNNIDLYCESLGEIPNILLSNNYQQLINIYPDEEPYIVDNNLEGAFLLNNVLPLGAYKAYIDHFSPQNITLNGLLDLDKLNFLIDKALLSPSLSNIQNMLRVIDSQYDETLAKSIIDLIMIYDQKESDGTLDWKTLFWRDDEISQDNSRTDFTTLFFSLKSVSAELKKEALNEFLLSKWNTELGKILTIEESTLFDIYSYLESDDLRVNFLNNFFGTIVTKVYNIRKYFGLFDCSEFKKLSNENKKFPEVLALKEHELLFDKLIEYNIAQKTLRKAKDGYIVVRNNKL